jgi:DNA-binding SARP family transcriptional activator
VRAPAFAKMASDFSGQLEPYEEPRVKPVLRLHLLGEFRVVRADAAQATPGAPCAATGFEGRHHVRALLALAGMSRQGVHRDELAELLWPKATAAHSSNRMHHTLHLARKVLAAVAADDTSWVLLRKAYVVLDERVWCDVQELQCAVAQSREETVFDNYSDDLKTAALVTSVMALCGHSWMPDLELGPTGQMLRKRVRDWQVAVLRHGVRRGEGDGDTPMQRALLCRLMQLQSTDEWASEKLMQLDLAAGRCHAVLREFDALRTALASQLGLRPSPHSHALQVQACQRLSRPGPVDPAPHRHAPLVGREALLLQLLAQTQQAPGLWQLTGPCGIGKSALACALAQRAAPLLADGACVVRLDERVAGDSALLAVARALGKPDGSTAWPQTADALVAWVHDELQTRCLLLVLDGVDMAEDSAALLACLPVQRLQARVVLTCRVPQHSLQLVSVDVRLPPLAVPALDVQLGLDSVSHSAGLTMFCMRCPQPEADQQDPRWRASAARLVAALEGLPLAIELAAARTATMTPDEVLRQCRADVKRLSAEPNWLSQTGPVDLVRRHRSLRDCFDSDLQTLTPATRRLYLELAQWPTGFGDADLADRWPTLGMCAVEGRARTQALHQAGLLVPVDDGWPSPLPPSASPLDGTAQPPCRWRLRHMAQLHARARTTPLAHLRLQEASQPHTRELVAPRGARHASVPSPKPIPMLLARVDTQVT